MATKVKKVGRFGKNRSEKQETEWAVCLEPPASARERQGQEAVAPRSPELTTCSFNRLTFLAENVAVSVFLGDCQSG